jgi:hypothetical protein
MELNYGNVPVADRIQHRVLLHAPEPLTSVRHKMSVCSAKSVALADTMKTVALHKGGQG